MKHLQHGIGVLMLCLLVAASGCSGEQAAEDGRLTGAVTEKKGSVLTLIDVPEEGNYTTTYLTVPESTAEQIDIGSYVSYLSDDYDGAEPAYGTSADIRVTGYHLSTWARNDQRVDEVIVRDTADGREAGTDTRRGVTQFTNILDDVAEKVPESGQEQAGPYIFIMEDDQDREILSFYMDADGRLVSDRGIMLPESGQAVADKLMSWAEEQLAQAD
ncbi:hypothetical protein [Paenibacillus sp. 1P07SE]|uniref:hypothetical protein n=1 Tax=Paenibacillus sp. 1P07SE TaxID=3132209 RepID=UPI0039A44334